MLFCREKIVVANLRTFLAYNFQRPQNALAYKMDKYEVWVAGSVVLGIGIFWSKWPLQCIVTHRLKCEDRNSVHIIELLLRCLNFGIAIFLHIPCQINLNYDIFWQLPFNSIAIQTFRPDLARCLLPIQHH